MDRELRPGCGPPGGGLPNLAIIPWTLGRTEQFGVHDTAGTAGMAGHVHAAWEEDVRHRLEGTEPG